VLIVGIVPPAGLARREPVGHDAYDGLEDTRAVALVCPDDDGAGRDTDAQATSMPP
jgi:hypothetical protein